MFKRLSIFFIVLLTLLAFTFGVSATDPGLFVEKDADNTYIDYVDADGTSIMKIDDTDGVTIASYTAGNTYSSMTITSTLDASSLTAGSIVTPGGIACAKQLFIGDDIDMSVSGTGTYDITLKDSVADALSIVGGSTDMIVFCTDTDSVTITPVTTITGLLTSGGGITVGSDGAGFDVTFYGDTSGSDFVWDQNGDTDASLTLGSSGGGKGVDVIFYGETNGNYLHWDRSGDDLLLVGTSTQLHIAGTTASTSSTTGSLKTAGGLGVAGNTFFGGTVTLGVDGTGTDFTLYGSTASHKIWWDANGDTSGAWYIGSDTNGILTTLYGDVTGCGVFWDPDGDTNGTLSIGATGGSKGVDLIAYGTTSGKYWKWDRSADSVVQTSALQIAPIATGTFVDFVLETEWTGGTLIDADFGGATTLASDTVGVELDLNGNITMTTDKDVVGYVIKLPALTQTAANTTAIKGIDLATAGALVQNTGAGAINWTGIDVQLPNLTQTTGTVTVIGVNVISGTCTSGTELGISVGANTAGLDVKFFANTTGNYLLWDESADDLMLVGTATQLDVAGTTDSTSVTTGSIQTDGGLGVAKDFFLGGDMSIATAKKITTVAELTLNTVDPLTIQVGGVDWLQMDEAAIAAFAGAADTAGHAVYIESEDGGADGGTGTGMAGGAISLKTGDGSSSATATAVGGAGGALSLITGAGLNGNTTGNGGVGGAIAITAGEGGDSGAGAGDGGAGGTITLTAGAGGGAGGGTAGAPGSVTIGAGVLIMGVQTIDMENDTEVLTLNPSTMAGTLLTGNILYVDANGGGAEILELPPEADCTGLMLVIVNTGGETITISNDAAGAVLSCETANTAVVVCDGTTWRGLVGLP